MCVCERERERKRERERERVAISALKRGSLSFPCVWGSELVLERESERERERELQYQVWKEAAFAFPLCEWEWVSAWERERESDCVLCSRIATSDLKSGLSVCKFTIYFSYVVWERNTRAHAPNTNMQTFTHTQSTRPWVRNPGKWFVSQSWSATKTVCADRKRQIREYIGPRF